MEQRYANNVIMEEKTEEVRLENGSAENVLKEENENGREEKAQNEDDENGREENLQTEENENLKQQKASELFACILQPSNGGVDPSYVGMRRLLLYRKAFAGCDQRRDWKCNGKGYVAYRNYIHYLKNSNHLQLTSQPSTPGNSHWVSSPGPLSLGYERDSWNSIKDMHGLNFEGSRRTSFSSTTSAVDYPQILKEPGYSFVGMHCIFDCCKGAAVTVVKFGHLSSDLLAYGVSDGR